ncbi:MULTISPECIES: hypothetical protein [Streptomyces]|uniref:hypothetical protein n=1 Tax=Streptomyces TaxID=1883 RepID=UPI0004CD6F46|nr:MULTISPECIES: hypothetical protein [Streptomyces]KOT49950.1 hypothetical protein ADK43_35140 [Streptomyces rimosus subsp. rimosus]
MSARDELLDEYGRADTAPLGTLADLRAKLDAVRAEVLREAADELDTLPADVSGADRAEHKYKGGAAAEALRRMADAAEGGGDDA